MTLKEQKHKVWFHILLAGLPYVLLLICGMLTDRYPVMYQYTEVILCGFIGMSILFLIPLVQSILQYRKQKKQEGLNKQ